MSSIPPLPDYLDVEAAEIEENHLATACQIILGDAPNPMDSVGPERVFFPTPHACIARWAGNDADRWIAVALEIMWPDEPWADVPVETLRSEHRDAAVMLCIVCNATPTQLYRALVNVAWNQWRENYNKQRQEKTDD